MDMDIPPPSPPAPTATQTTATQTTATQTTQSHGTRPKAREFTSCIISKPTFSYAHLTLTRPSLLKAHEETDIITARTHLTSALSQFLGVHGSAISIDILKVEKRDVWIRVPREDLSVVVAAVGGWVRGRSGAGEGQDGVGWRVQGTGNWLSTLVAHSTTARIWEE